MVLGSARCLQEMLLAGILASCLAPNFAESILAGVELLRCCWFHGFWGRTPPLLFENHRLGGVCHGHIGLSFCPIELQFCFSWFWQWFQVQTRIVGQKIFPTARLLGSLERIWRFALWRLLFCRWFLFWQFPKFVWMLGTVPGQKLMRTWRLQDLWSEASEHNHRAVGTARMRLMIGSLSGGNELVLNVRNGEDLLSFGIVGHA